jgi:DNA-binding beta-propeller fold protein YncE/mono/diheme cytochrome c family protein
MKVRSGAIALIVLLGAFLAHAAVTGTSPAQTLQRAVAAVASLAQARLAATGPGLGNLTYTQAQLFKPISWIKSETSPGAGDGDIPFRHEGRKDYGTNVALMVNGYFLTMFAPDSGQSTGGFLLYDVSDPRNIRLVKKIYDPAGTTAEFREPHAIGSATINGRLYIVVPSTKGVEFWDFTDVNDIRQVKKVALPTVDGGDYAKVSWQLWWQAPYLYVASADDGIYIVDAKDPANAVIANRGEGRPNPVPTGELGGFRVGPIFTMGNHMVISSMETSTGLASLDISDPLNPKFVDGVGALPFYYATCFDGLKLYGSARNADGRMFGYDLSDPGRFVAEDQRLAIPDQLYCATQDDFVFQGAQEKVHKVSVKDPLNHLEVGHGALFAEGSEAAHHSDHGQVMPMGNLVYVGNDHGSGSGFIVHDRNKDLTPPKVRTVSPRPGSQGQALTSRIGVAFSDSILHGSVNAASFIVRPKGGSPVAGTYSVQLGIVNFAPAQPLQPGTTYEVSIPAQGVRDYAGNAVTEAYKAEFTTEPAQTVHNWPLSASLADVVGGNNGQASPADAFADGALNFAGRSGGVPLASDSVATTLGGSATLSFHMRTTQAGAATPAAAPGIFGRDQAGGQDDVFWGWIDVQGRLRLSVGEASSANPGVASTVVVNDGAWHHVILSRDAVTGMQVMYVDGIRTTAPGLTGARGLNTRFRTLGQFEGAADFFRGSLSNVRVYGRVLTDAQAVAMAGVVHHWPLLSTLRDVAGGVHGVSGAGDAFGEGGLNLASRGAGVELGSDAVAVTLSRSASVAFHMKTTQTGHADPWRAPGLFGRDESGGTNDMFWGWLDDGGRLRLSVGNLSSDNPGTASPQPVNDGQWHFVVMTRNAITGAQALYVDGVKTTGTGTAGVFGLASKFRRLGQIEGNDEFFRGVLSNVRVFDRALSDAEAASLLTRPTVRVPGQAGEEWVGVNQRVNFHPAALARAGAQYSWNFGDGSARTAFSGTLATSHAFSAPGHYTVVLTVRQSDGTESYYAFQRTATRLLTARAPAHSTNITGAGSRVYSVNPDSGTVAAIDTATQAKVWETAVGNDPKTLAVAPDGRVWVTVQGDDKLVALAADGTVARTVQLAYGSGPHGVVFTPDGQSGLVTLESKSQLISIDPVSGATVRTLSLDGDLRGLAVTADSQDAYVTRFRSLAGGAQVHRVNLPAWRLTQTVPLQVDTTTVDAENRARGVPNYLHQIVISPDGTRAALPSKKDNIARGGFRDQQPLEHDRTVRSIVSQIALAAHSAEVFAEQLDFNDRAPARAVVYSPKGDYLFVAQMEGNRVAIVDAYNRAIRGEIETGRAPHGLYLDAATQRLYINDFLGRSVTVQDVSAVLSSASFASRRLATVPVVAREPLTASVLRGKKIFYNAADPRMSRDNYMSCASCHADGGDDGTVWDFTQRGEGLRRTISLKGRGGLGHGRLHWSANFDEVQDFEGDVRRHLGGTGFMSDADFQATVDALGTAKAGRSAALDDLAAYVGSLTRYPRSPYREAGGQLSPVALQGQRLFTQLQCATCHGGAALRDGLRHDVGTLQPSSGQGNGEALAGKGIDTPTLRALWVNRQYFHNGQAASLDEVLRKPGHGNAAGRPQADRDALTVYLNSLDGSP